MFHLSPQTVLLVSFLSTIQVPDPAPKPIMTPLTPFDQMTPAEQDALFEAMANDDSDEAAHAHLAQGNPIYVSTPDTPKGFVEKRFPDGRRQFVRFDLDGEHVVVDNVQTVSGSAPEP